MKKIIVKTLLFLLLLLIPFLLLNRYVLNITGKNDYFKLHFNEIRNQNIHANSIIIGTSKSLHGMQPLLLNNDSNVYFNFSLNGSTAGYYKKWYDDLLTAHYPTPKRVIICADLSFLDNAPHWRQYEQDAEYFPASTFAKHLFRDNGTNTLMLLKNRFPATKQLRNIFRLRKQTESPFRITQYASGYIPYETFFTTGKAAALRKEFSLAYKNEFELLLRQLQQSGINVLFIQMPEYSLEKMVVYEQMNINLYYDSLAKRLQIPFLNYNTQRFTSINRTMEYYSDRVHLNHKGSTVFSKMLRADLDSLANQPLLQ